MTIQTSRIKNLNNADASSGDYVLYWMQQSQRAEENHALEYAIDQANRQDRPVVVIFTLTENYPDANLRHYTFMLEGLRETQKTLKSREIQMVIRIGDPVKEALTLGRSAAMIVCDRGYLRHQRSWRKALAKQSLCKVVQVETDVVIPVEAVSGKAEYAAYTIRPKINRHLDQFLVSLPATKTKHSSLNIALDGLDIKNIQALLTRLNTDHSISPVTRFFKGGTSEAKCRLDEFIEHRFHRYAEERNEPKTAVVSFMSPYLHFGQISPLYLALKIKACEHLNRASATAYLEELITRRELAINFVFFQPLYDSLECLPNWAKQTLADHRKDNREHTYSTAQLLACSTHDPYWNAAMKEMIVSGYMHNYMRMYWGKKILEWRVSAESAYKTIINLNNTYFLDGRDPNSYAGAGWIFGLHDRAWFERPVFGKVRYMAASGLERKFDINGYVNKINRISDEV